MTEYMAHFVDRAHWLLKEMHCGKITAPFYDTDDIFLFLIGYCPNHFFFTFVLCYPF